MTKRVSTFAIMACLVSSLAFAGEKSVTTSDTTTNNTDVRSSAKDKNTAKVKRNAKPAPSKEEQEFDRMLLGIHG
jgi:hypothetical protein